MSDSSDKQFAPTHARLAKARREGNVARSPELPANVAFAVALVAVSVAAPVMFGCARSAVVAAAHGRIDASSYLEIALCALATLAAAACAACLISLVQNGGLVIVAPVPKFEKLVPWEGMKRIFSRESVSHALRAVAAVSIAGIAMWGSIARVAGASVGSSSVLAIAAGTWNGARTVAFAAAGVGLAFAALEYGVARRSWLSKLKMSLHELKRELKENDGDPMLRHRRRTLHRSFAAASIRSVKEASFVVVNPTHVAVAVKYAPPEVPVPVVLVRAMDDLALEVRELARDAGVPIIEDVPLARALFAQTNVGDPIPAEHFVAVAEIVAQLVRHGVLE